MCKPYKHPGFSKGKARREIAGTGGFGKLRAEISASQDARCDPMEPDVHPAEIRAEVALALRGGDA